MMKRGSVGNTPGPSTWTMHAMTENTYDGWSNYETWAVAIWLDTDQSSHLYWREQARRHREMSPQCEQVVDGTWTPENATKYNLADQLKEEINGNAPDVFSGAYSDLLHSALTEVNWEEIAAHYIEKEKEAAVSVRSGDLRLHPRSGHR